MVSLKFHCQSNDGTTIELNADSDILSFIVKSENNLTYILELDRSTAIKFSKELRKQIALLD
jgi:hypothetical protein